jgi:hypothetical protein
MSKKILKATAGASLLLALFSILMLFAFHPVFASDPVCEDYCYNYYFQCRQQGGSMDYCTDWMTWCLIVYCGW